MYSIPADAYPLGAFKISILKSEAICFDIFLMRRCKSVYEFVVVDLPFHFHHLLTTR